jgi:hypothetical protein
MHIRHALNLQESETYSPASRERSRGTFWLPRTVAVGSGGAWPRSCPAVLLLPRMDGLDHRPVGRVGPGEPSAPGNAAHTPHPGPSHHGCLQLLGLGGPVSVTAAG